MARFMQPFVVTMPHSRHRRRQYLQQPSLEQEFADILGELISTRRPASETAHCWPLGQCTRREDSVYQPFWAEFMGLGSRRPWVHVLNMQEFEGGDISVEVENGSLHIHAKREDTDGSNSDLIERKREVKLPQDIDKERLACYLSEDGRFIIKAPYISKKPVAEREKQREVKRDTKGTDPQESVEVPIGREEEGASGSEKVTEKPSRQPPATSLADFVVSALTGDYPNGGYPHSSGPFQGDDYVMVNGGEDEKCELTTLAHTTDIVEEDGKKVYCVKVKLPSYPPESIKVRCHGKTMYIDAKREVEESGIYHCHEFHRIYTLPEGAAEVGAKAQMDDSGMVTVKVPLLELKAPESIDILIETEEQKRAEQKGQTVQPCTQAECENQEVCKDQFKCECKTEIKPEGQ